MPKTYINMKIRFSLSVEQILAFTSVTNLVREGDNLASYFKQIP